MKHNNIDDLGFGTAVPDIPDEDASDELAIGAPVAALVNVGNETTEMVHDTSDDDRFLNDPAFLELMKSNNLGPITLAWDLLQL